MSLRKMVSMERSAPQVEQAPYPASIAYKYDYGLTLRLSHETLEKLNLDDEDVEPGDEIHIVAKATVTSVSKNDVGNGEKCCVELQIVSMGVEDENTEYEDTEYEDDED